MEGREVGWGGRGHKLQIVLFICLKEKSLRKVLKGNKNLSQRDDAVSGELFILPPSDKGTAQNILNILQALSQQT